MTRPAALVTALALASAVMLSGCTSTPPAPETSEASTAAPVTEETAPDFSDLSIYYPVALGNSWTYRMTSPDPVGVVTYDETMTAVDAEPGGGWRVAITRDFHYENGSSPDFSDAVEYIFHEDGSLTVPYNSAPDGSGAEVTVTSGAMRFPTLAEFESATPVTGQLTVTVVTEGQTINQEIAFTIVGQGVESVTVPAGTFDARRLGQDLAVSMPDLGVTDIRVNSVSWLAEGTGVVRTELADLLGTGGSIVTELVEFRPAA